jgi:protein phosphatase
VLVHCLCTRQLEKPLLVEQHRLRAGDRLIFASDGLTDSVGHDELAKTSTEHPEARGAAAALVELAQQTGARDNITCIVVDLVA